MIDAKLVESVFGGSILLALVVFGMYYFRIYFNHELEKDKKRETVMDERLDIILETRQEIRALQSRVAGLEQRLTKQNSPQEEKAN